MKLNGILVKSDMQSFGIGEILFRGPEFGPREGPRSVTRMNNCGGLKKLEMEEI